MLTIQLNNCRTVESARSCIPSDDSAQDICARCLNKGLVCEYTPVSTAEEDGPYTNLPPPPQEPMPSSLPPGNVARNTQHPSSYVVQNHYSPRPGTPGRPLQSPHTHHGSDPSFSRPAADGGWGPQYSALHGGQPVTHYQPGSHYQPVSHYPPGASESSLSTSQTPYIQGHSTPQNAWFQSLPTPFPCWCLANPCYCGGLRR
ncbi:hypothetical protein C8F04DRAFT_658053 [Mycena alexandri]|uniref:Zn(2)-C6 fungal-type domain-containing protein n=1 Tax=Mycena alexandri TaxID=1745969 RepID=A0AAD6X1K1_9AGAR|nr:hypothetical protein C8F04DRAFT_658053 [Mycena alexandri]